MTRTDPYTTNESKYPDVQRRIHHTWATCPDGSRIAKEDRVRGTEGRPLCESCRLLEEADAARARIPRPTSG